MAEMLREPERDRLIAYLERRLLRSVALDGLSIQALRETHAPFPTAAWCWTADAAAAVELLAQPELRGKWGGLTDDLTDFLLAMGTGDLLLRRVAAPECIVVKPDPRNFSIRTGTHDFQGDLSKGLVRQSVRGGPARRDLRHTGHLVEFRLGRQRHCLDVEDTIEDFGLDAQPGRAILFHESLLKVPSGLLRKGETVVGRLRYEYTIRSGDPRLMLAVTLRAEPGVTLADVRLTTALDDLSGEARRPIAQIVLGAATGAAYRTMPVPSAGLATLQQGAVGLISLVEEAPPGAANGIHIRPMAPESVLNVKGQAQSGRLHWLLTRYATPRLEGGEAFTVQEARLLTAGTLAPATTAYAAMLHDPNILSGRDPGLTADHGTALNAMATQILFARHGAYNPPVPPERLAAMQSWYDRHLRAFFDAMGGASQMQAARSYLRSLAFALLSLDTMQRATGDDRYWALLEQGVALMLPLQRPDENGGAFADPEQAAYLDCHAAAMLALARILLRAPEPALQQSLRRALGAIRLGSVDVALEDGKRHNLDTPFVRGRRADGAWEDDGGFWSFKLGLLMRALKATRLARDAGALALEPAELQRLQTLLDAGFRALRGRVRDEPGCLEVLTSPLAGEGNAATQPIVLLGLMAPDAAVARMAEPAPALA